MSPSKIAGITLTGGMDLMMEQDYWHKKKKKLYRVINYHVALDAWLFRGVTPLGNLGEGILMLSSSIVEKHFRKPLIQSSHNGGLSNT